MRGPVCTPCLLAGQVIGVCCHTAATSIMMLLQRQAIRHGRLPMHHGRLAIRGTGSQRLPRLAVCGGNGLRASRLQLCNSNIAVTGPVGNHLQKSQKPAVDRLGPGRTQPIPHATMQEALPRSKLPAPAPPWLGCCLASSAAHCMQVHRPTDRAASRHDAAADRGEGLLTELPAGTLLLRAQTPTAPNTEQRLGALQCPVAAAVPRVQCSCSGAGQQPAKAPASLPQSHHSSGRSRRPAARPCPCMRRARAFTRWVCIVARLVSF